MILAHEGRKEQNMRAREQNTRAREARQYVELKARMAQGQKRHDACETRGYVKHGAREARE